MAQVQFSKFFSLLHSDTAFRKEFAASPAKAMKDAGFDPTMFALPHAIDFDQLTQRLNKIFNGTDHLSADIVKAAPNLSADELWKRFNVIGLASDMKSLLAAEGDTSAVVVAVVVYGASMVTSNSTSVVTTVGKKLQIESIEQLQALRTLSRTPKGQLQFSISGPDGSTVHQVGADTMSAFLARLK